MRPILLGLAMLAFSCAALAQQYKWVDQNGRVRYGDRPPPGVRATLLRPPSGAPSAPASKPAAKGRLSPAEQEAAFRKRRQDAEKASEKQVLAREEAQARKQNCARARGYLRTLESGQRIARTDGKGERYYLNDAQIARETGQTQQSVQQWCN